MRLSPTVVLALILSTLLVLAQVDAVAQSRRNFEEIRDIQYKLSPRMEQMLARVPEDTLSFDQMSEEARRVAWTFSECCARFRGLAQTFQAKLEGKTASLSSAVEADVTKAPEDLRKCLYKGDELSKLMLKKDSASKEGEALRQTVSEMFTALNAKTPGARPDANTPLRPELIRSEPQSAGDGGANR